MNKKHVAFLLFIMVCCSCKKDPTGPETDCELLSHYDFDYGFVQAAKVYDVRTNPPTEIKNGILEYDLFYQFLFLRDEDPAPYPYNEYFMDSINFPDDHTAVLHFWKDYDRIYTLHRDDCQVDLTSQDDSLHMELTQGGDEINSWRFAVYEHVLPKPLLDSFIFLEWREGAFLSYENVIRQFALDYPGQYDTIAIELLHNRTKE